MIPVRLITLAALALAALGACRDPSRFSNDGDHYEGTIVGADFVRAGLASDTRLCLTLDAGDLQVTPGTMTTSDGRFSATPLRPIPQLLHDPLSLLAFGQGRERNLVYAAAPRATSQGVSEPDALVVVSLMQSGNVEVRVLRGAPGPAPSSGEPPMPPPFFGVFPLERKPGPCSF